MLLLGFERFVHPICIMATGSVTLRDLEQLTSSSHIRSQGTLARHGMAVDIIFVYLGIDIRFFSSHHRYVTRLRFFINRHHVLCFDMSLHLFSRTRRFEQHTIHIQAVAESETSAQAVAVREGFTHGVTIGLEHGHLLGRVRASLWLAKRHGCNSAEDTSATLSELDDVERQLRRAVTVSASRLGASVSQSTTTGELAPHHSGMPAGGCGKGGEGCCGGGSCAGSSLGADDSEHDLKALQVTC